jgi:hypothetical protein
MSSDRAYAQRCRYRRFGKPPPQKPLTRDSTTGHSQGQRQGSSTTRLLCAHAIFAYLLISHNKTSYWCLESRPVAMEACRGFTKPSSASIQRPCRLRRLPHVHAYQNRPCGGPKDSRRPLKQYSCRYAQARALAQTSVQSDSITA